MFRRRPKWKLACGVGRPGGRLDVSLSVSSGDLDPTTVDISIDGKKEVTADYTVGDGMPSTQASATIRWLRREGALSDGSAQIELPVWAPPSIVGAKRFGPASWLCLYPLEHGGRQPVEIHGLPVHETLLEATGMLGWQLRKGQIWQRPGGGTPPFELRLVFKPGEGIDHGGCKITELHVSPVASAPDAASVAIAVIARKTPHGLFTLAALDDVPLGSDAAAWAADVRDQLGAAIAAGTLPDGRMLEESAIRAVIEGLARL